MAKFSANVFSFLTNARPPVCLLVWSPLVQFFGHNGDLVQFVVASGHIFFRMLIFKDQPYVSCIQKESCEIYSSIPDLSGIKIGIMSPT